MEGKLRRRLTYTLMCLRKGSPDTTKNFINNVLNKVPTLAISGALFSVRENADVAITNTVARSADRLTEILWSIEWSDGSFLHVQIRCELFFDTNLGKTLKWHRCGLKLIIST